MNGMKSLCLLFILACTLSAQVLYAAPLSIKDFDVAGDGKKEDTPGFVKAWEALCKAAGGGTLEIPEGSYLIGAITFEGPCKGPVKIQLDGKLLALPNPTSFKENWLQFEHIEGITITGKGTVDGQGASTWAINKHNAGMKKTFPMNMVFAFVNKLTIHGITSLNSKYFHINIFSSKNIELTNMVVTAPGDSPNTDGIHIGDNTNVTIKDIKVGTGDDCISIGPGSVDVKISNIDCGPGHGISVGSLGRYQKEADVKGLTVTNCTLTKTTNGVRIKTWQDNPTPLTASDIHFEDIKMKDVTNPILIDQKYCPHNDCSAKNPSTVKIEQVTFKNIKGTSATPQTVSIICSDKLPCEGIQLKEIDLKCPAGTSNTTCVNAKGSADATVKSTCLE